MNDSSTASEPVPSLSDLAFARHFIAIRDLVMGVGPRYWWEAGAKWQADRHALEVAEFKEQLTAALANKSTAPER